MLEPNFETLAQKLQSDHFLRQDLLFFFDDIPFDVLKNSVFANRFFLLLSPSRVLILILRIPHRNV